MLGSVHKRGLYYGVFRGRCKSFALLCVLQAIFNCCAQRVPRRWDDLNHKMHLLGEGCNITTE
jgi:hypothetical protein